MNNLTFYFITALILFLSSCNREDNFVTPEITDLTNNGPAPKYSIIIAGDTLIRTNASPPSGFNSLSYQYFSESSPNYKLDIKLFSSDPVSRKMQISHTDDILTTNKIAFALHSNNHTFYSDTSSVGTVELLKQNDSIYIYLDNVSLKTNDGDSLIQIKATCGFRRKKTPNSYFWSNFFGFTPYLTLASTSGYRYYWNDYYGKSIELKTHSPLTSGTYQICTADSVGENQIKVQLNETIHMAGPTDIRRHWILNDTNQTLELTIIPDGIIKFSFSGLRAKRTVSGGCDIYSSTPCNPRIFDVILDDINCLYYSTDNK